MIPTSKRGATTTRPATSLFSAADTDEPAGPSRTSCFQFDAGSSPGLLQQWAEQSVTDSSTASGANKAKPLGTHERSGNWNQALGITIGDHRGAIAHTSYEQISHDALVTVCVAADQLRVQRHLFPAFVSSLTSAWGIDAEQVFWSRRSRRLSGVRQVAAYQAVHPPSTGIFTPVT